MGKPGYIYTAKVLTCNGYEGIKIGMTTRTPAQRYKEHRTSGDFRKFEPINAWPVPADGKSWCVGSGKCKNCKGAGGKVTPRW